MKFKVIELLTQLKILKGLVKSDKMKNLKDKLIRAEMSFKTQYEIHRHYEMRRTREIKMKRLGEQHHQNNS